MLNRMHGRAASTPMAKKYFGARATASTKRVQDHGEKQDEIF